MDSPIVAQNVNNQNPVVDAAEASKDQQPLLNSSNGDVLFTAVANLNGLPDNSLYSTSTAHGAPPFSEYSDLCLTFTLATRQAEDRASQNQWQGNQKSFVVQPWTCHGLHESWQGRCRESFRIHGQPASVDVGDSCYFLGSANVGRSRRCFSNISLNSKTRRKLDKYMRCNDWNMINETIRAQGLANAHI